MKRCGLGRGSWLPASVPLPCKTTAKLPALGAYDRCDTQVMVFSPFYFFLLVCFITFCLFAHSGKGAWGFSTSIFLLPGSQGLVKSPRQARNCGSHHF